MNYNAQFFPCQPIQVNFLKIQKYSCHLPKFFQKAYLELPPAIKNN